jgi:transposase
MLTGMTEEDWGITLEAFDAAQSRSGEPGHDDRKFLEALHYFTVHNVTWRALPAEFGKWNSVWKRFWRLSRTGVFEAFFQMLAETSKTAHLWFRCSTAPWYGLMFLRRAQKRLSWLSSIVSLFHDLPRAAAPQGWRCAPPPSAASALTRRDPCQSGF